MVVTHSAVEFSRMGLVWFLKKEKWGPAILMRLCVVVLGGWGKSGRSAKLALMILRGRTLVERQGDGGKPERQAPGNLGFQFSSALGMPPKPDPIIVPL